MGKRREQESRGVLPAYPSATVWAVTTYLPDCHDDDCYCDGGEGTAVVALFTTEQTAAQFADRKNGGRDHGPYRAQKLPIHTTMRDLP